MKHLLRIFLTLIIVLLLGSILSFFFISEPSLNVRLVSVSQETINNDIEVTASIKSEYQYTLYSPIEGIVRNLDVSLGEMTSKDQLLAHIEKRKKDKVIDTQAETRLRNLVSQYTLAIRQSREELDRINQAVNSGVLSRYKLEEVRSSLQRANAQQMAAKEELTSYQHDKRSRQALRQKQVKVKSLSNGIITRKFAYDGQWVRQGDPLVSIISTDELAIKAMLSPQQVNQLSLGQSVIVSKQDSTISWTETLIRISPVISQDRDTKNLQEITVSLLNADEIKKAINEKVRLKINNTTVENNLSLPIEALIPDGKNFYILSVDKNKKADFSEVYTKKGFFSALQLFKCQISNCKVGIYGLSKHSVLIGNSNLNRVEIKQALSKQLKIIIPNSGIDENSLVTLETNR